MGSYEKSLDMMSVGGDGNCLSKEILHKLDLLIQHSNGLCQCNVYSPRNESINGLNEFNFPIDVEDEDRIIITFEKYLSSQQQHQMQKTIHDQTKQQMMKKKMTV